MALPVFGSALDTWLRHTADMLTLITTEKKEIGIEKRGDEGDIRGLGRQERAVRKGK